MKINARTLPWLPWMAFIPAAGAMAMLLLAGPAARFGWWHFRTSFDVMRWAAYIGAAAAVLSILAAAMRLRHRRPVFWCLVALVLGAGAFGVPWHQLRTARSVPPIHDISTDTDNPPAFVAVTAALRGPDTNPLEYGGAELARAQHEAYPDLAPLALPVPPAQAFARALAAAKQMGWAIVAQDETAGRIEATATTFWFGFKDDIVVRIAAADGGSRVDVRSVSRVGKSDLGTNARRIRQYLAAL